MKTPEDYFNVKDTVGKTSYEWRDNGNIIGIIVIGAIILVPGFVKSFIEKNVPAYYFFILLTVFIAIILFFWIKDRSRVTITTDEITVAKGLDLLLGNPGIKYARKDVQYCYKKNTSTVFNLEFISSSTLLFLLLKDGTSVKLHNGSTDENEKYFLSEMKSFFRYGEEPSPRPLKTSAKIIVLVPIIVFLGVITPRMMEVGEYALEKQSDTMRFASGLLIMGLVYWIVTSADLIFKPGELEGRGKLLLFLISFSIGTAILYYRHLA